MVITDDLTLYASPASGFAALGSPARLAILRVLVRAGERGLTVGAIQERTQLAGSTLAHHLHALVAADLAYQRKEGRSVFTRVNYTRVQGLAGFLMDECCADEGKS